MSVLALLKQLLVFNPKIGKGLEWIFVAAIILVVTLYINSMNYNYMVSSQRIQLQMETVTPYEIELIKDLCIFNRSPLESLIFDKEVICPKEIKEFFHATITNPNTPGPKKG